MKKIIIAAMLGLGMLTSCVDLDIAPKNMMTSDDLLSNEAGMEIYLAELYSNLPLEDLKYLPERGLDYNGWLCSKGIEGTGEAVGRDGLVRTFTGESSNYWDRAFPIIRKCNFLMENLPQYKGNYSDVAYNNYLGQAYFCRAMIFTHMAMRFGGFPLVTRVINYPGDAELEVPRSTEEQAWDQILSDYDMAAELLAPESLKRGYVNRYVALAYKSSAMLYAGSVAKYNQTVDGHLTGFGSKTGVRVIGFDETRWEAASKKYFSEAYKAASTVITDGKYALHKAKWVAGDAQAQFENLVDMTSNLSSPEHIWVKEYLYPTTTHGYDNYNGPYLPGGAYPYHSPLSCGTCPTADFVELFDGFERYSDGTLKVTTGDNIMEGEYLMFDDPYDFFKNAEPRLRAQVIFPGDYFAGQKVEMYAGSYTGSLPATHLMDDYSYGQADQSYTNGPKGGQLVMSSSPTEVKYVTAPDGSQKRATGPCGPYKDWGESGVSGLVTRKWLDPDFRGGREGVCDQPYILMRYAEVLLDAAEAAVELALAGAPSPDNTDMLAVATQAIKDIRERAGADPLLGSLTGSIESRNIVRKERRKELAFEHQVKWDLRRWRVQHYAGRDGFWGETRNKDKFSDNNNYRCRGLYPFYCTENGKYFFDTHFQNMASKQFSYNQVDYYFEVPGGQVAKSPVIDQQPNR
ncbi:RagB/SusD family nutrient uptake outer membrane protein [uncultured Muribaculum sp.]|uniref:RagB/SusD family nutrient uptake outer membrane protein n=1 Tax=uncultured Muribaculum sp. TaxID=1918613 RepID=UPI0025EF5423|nr:RagB/SusD family nutrient uptake outer membrane protein [uncultured Muribaculum sp.]